MTKTQSTYVSLYMLLLLDEFSYEHPTEFLCLSLRYLRSRSTNTNRN